MSPDNRRHRGAHPADRKIFAAEQIPALREAVSELSWLLNRGYAAGASLKLVGDRHKLVERQRSAVARAACTDAQRDRRQARRLDMQNVENQSLAVDSFNLIITVEAALGGGILIMCRDGCLRDLSSVHGSYRAVDETERAIILMGEALSELKPKSVWWLLDRPVSNSGRLAARINRLAGERGWPWSVDVVFNPDHALPESNRIVVSSDSAVLDGGGGAVDKLQPLFDRPTSSPVLVNRSLRMMSAERFKPQMDTN